MQHRITHKRNIEITPAGFQEAMALYAQAGLRGLEINKAIQAEINAVMERYEHELQCTAHSQSSMLETIKSYCKNNKQALFGKRRSIGTPYGVAGFRLGAPRLKISRSTSWASILQQLKTLLPNYIRTTEEPAKDLLLADRNKEHVASALMQLGIQIVQDEKFYIDTKQAA